jgi:signal transduction histidine kinase
MTPKEKALDLVDKFRHSIEYVYLQESISIQCALISVEEVIEALDEHHWQNRNVTEYYIEVKDELEKL